MRPLFLGHIEESLVYPYPLPPPEEGEVVELVLETFRRFAADHIDAERFDREASYPTDVLRGLGEIGLMGVVVPEKYGGLGMSQYGFSRVMEAVTACDGATAVTVGAHLCIGMKAILMYGTEDQKARFLPRMATGEMIGAFALTEPGAGSDVQAIQTTAKAQSDGTFVLNGTKLWITNGGFADVFTVFARTGTIEVDGAPRHQLTAFLVTRDMPGVSTGREEAKLGIRGSSTTEVNLEDVTVPEENVLGEVGKGFKVAMEVLNDGRVSLAAGCIGMAKGLLAEAHEAAKSRRAFGRPIAEFELIQHKLGWMATQIYVMESMVYLTAGLLDRGDVDYALESAACKIFCSERTWEIANEALQINGGNGFMQGLPYERALRDARVNLIFEGTNEVLRLFVALSGFQTAADYLKNVSALKDVSVALEDPLEALGVLSDFALRKVKRVVAPESLSGVHHLLHKASGRLADSGASFAAVVERALRHYRKGIVERQFIQKRSAEMATDLYAMAATISRTDSLIRSRKPEEVVVARRMCDLFVERAWRRVRRDARRVDFDSDAPLTGIARDVCEQGGYRVPEPSPPGAP
jgi:acyl-CoA dehydrogenase family protein 9